MMMIMVLIVKIMVMMIMMMMILIMMIMMMVMMMVMMMLRGDNMIMAIMMVTNVEGVYISESSFLLYHFVLSPRTLILMALLARLPTTFSLSVVLSQSEYKMGKEVWVLL